MADHTYNDFIQNIESIKIDASPTYLIHGDEYLVKDVSRQLKSKLLPEKKQKTNVTIIDGAIENIPSAIEQLNTYALMPGTQIIVINDSQIFYAGQDRSALLEKGQTAFADNKINKAANFFLNLLAAEKMTIADIQSERLDETIQLITEDSSQHAQWIKDVAAHCISQKLTVPDLMNYSDMLTETIEKGFAKRNVLIITTDTVQKNRRLYKAIVKHGIVVNCQVPKGFLKADKDQQEKTFRENAQQILTKSGKSMASEAYAMMREMLGPGLRNFTVSLEKLIQYVGERKNITREDVVAVLERSRQDPIFELTSALAARNLIDALAVLDNLFDNQFNPLQAIAAIANQVRRLLLIEDVKSRYKGIYRKGMSFAHFKNSFFSNVLEYDQQLAESASSESTLDNTISKTKKAKVNTTLIIAKNPKSIYPVYLSFKSSENYSRHELIQAIQILYEADKRIKTGSQNNNLIIERAIIEICRRNK
jgi:DNA polymerase-3 subunit delta